MGMTEMVEANLTNVQCKHIQKCHVQLKNTNKNIASLNCFLSGIVHQNRKVPDIQIVSGNVAGSCIPICTFRQGDLLSPGIWTRVRNIARWHLKNKMHFRLL
jgi:hypothetical protein